jgi:hypothetical protein
MKCLKHVAAAAALRAIYIGNFFTTPATYYAWLDNLGRCGTSGK